MASAKRDVSVGHWAAATLSSIPERVKTGRKRTRLSPVRAQQCNRRLAEPSTFGHVILGVDEATLAAVRAHEQVHVRQYERWGPFFGPAYLLSSLLQLLRGRSPYRDNLFEREAFAKAGCADAPGSRSARR
jgi:hypothetical protein